MIPAGSLFVFNVMLLPPGIQIPGPAVTFMTGSVWQGVEPVHLRSFAASARGVAPMMRGLPLPLPLRVFFADLFGLQRP